MGLAVRHTYYLYNESEGETSLDEFCNFICLPENQDKSFELAEGYIVMMAGNASTNHQRICGYIARKIGNYLEGKGCEVFQDLNIYLFKDNIGECKNVFQPDIMIGCDKNKFTSRGYEGTPEFIVEVISKSTAYNDYFLKYHHYMRFGVKEYWIADLFKNQIVVHINDGDDVPQSFVYTFDSTIKISVLDDLSIDFKEILKNIH